MPTDPTLRPGRVPAYRGITTGEVALAAFVLCVASGLLLVGVYDPHDPAASIAGWLLGSPGAVFARNVHYWTAQLFLLGTALHLWDHFRAATEHRVRPGVWTRLILSLPVIAYLLLSGFLLRGDADARQARLLLTEILARLPLVGPDAAAFLVGPDGQWHVLYVQHAATATLLVWLVIIEHVRRLWPKAPALVGTALLTGAGSLLLSPGLHDGFAPQVKGPWYFLGLQELLHWTPWPLLLVGAGFLGLALAWSLPRQSPSGSARTKRLLLAATAGYLLLCGVGLFLRGEDWRWQPGWPRSRSDLQPGWIAPAAPPGGLPARLPAALGQPEGCLVCHATLTGLDAAHRPESVGCASCHGGNRFTLDPQRAHAGMLLVPGQLADTPRTCGLAGCHPDILPRVEQSLMATFSGVIDVNRRVFGESTAPAASPPQVRSLGTSAADSHLRQLCVSCHLGQTKEEWGPIVQESRGGGCLACHLTYSPAALAALADYESRPRDQRRAIPSVHPAFTLRIDRRHCFGCHSRSGRISTNYEGWHELREPPPEAATPGPLDPARFRLLDDGRYFSRQTPDVHHERNLDCIDCHPAAEIMGDGRLVAHKRAAVQLRCEDCHARSLPSLPADRLDPESLKLLALRSWPGAPATLHGRTRTGGALVNVVVDEDGTGRLRRKPDGAFVPLKAPLPVCVEGGGHRRLSCASCHTGWAPRCASCHTAFAPEEEAFDHLAQSPVRGAWQESSGAFAAAPPTLGLRLDPADPDHPAGAVDTFVPGMILELDRNRKAGGTPDPVFRRLYALTAAHTTRREARSCVSCHNDPVALGYGQGTLLYSVAEGVGRWRFLPAHAPAPQDGLPADAWIGYLQNRTGEVSTRGDVRPFTVEEQQRILLVGACLTCHAGDSPVMQHSVTDFAAILARRRPVCVLPVWPATP